MMQKQFSYSMATMLLIAMLALSGCNVDLKLLPTDGTSGDSQEMAAAEPTEAPAVEPTEEPAEEPATEPTEAPAEEPAEEAPEESTPIPPTSTPVPAPTATPELEAADPLVSITTSSLRIRSGPGTQYEILGAASQGESFVITGQAFNCGWYQIRHPQYGISWTSGSADFVTTTDADCAQIPEAAAPPAPTAAPQPAAPAQDSGSQAGASQGGGDELPTDKGCYLFQNQLGAELNVTITNANDGSAVANFKVPSNAEEPYCLWPGKYNITIDAPPPWSDMNDTVNVAAGQHFLFPVRAR